MLPAKIDERSEKEYHIYHKHSDILPYLPQTFYKVIQIPVYSSYLILPDESHSVTILITPRSALGPHCLLRLRLNTKVPIAIGPL